MQVVSLSPLPVGSLLWQPRSGAWVFTFVCKATYSLQSMESPLAPDEEQEPPNEADRPWSEDVQSLYAPCDLVPIKPRADVVLVGNAFAPRPSRSIVARLVVGESDKTIELFCDRTFTQEGALEEGPPFQRMPLIYERAAGGPGTSNPVGMPNDERDMYGRLALPNLQPTGIHVTKPTDRIAPIGFGPIAASWPDRVEKLGRHAASWSHYEWNHAPLPDDVDPGYFNCAPRDQQISALRENEPIVLEHLHPEHRRLVTSLPGVRPRAFLDTRRGDPHGVLAMRADTLWIDTVRSLCTLTWRGQLPISRPDEQGSVLIAMERPGQKLGWADIDRMSPPSGRAPQRHEAPPRRPEPPAQEEQTRSEAPRPRPPPLPAAAQPHERPRAITVLTPPSVEATGAIEVGYTIDGKVTLAGGDRASALPFSAPANPPPARRDEPAPSTGALPFRAAAPTAAPPIAVPPIAAPPIAARPPPLPAAAPISAPQDDAWRAPIPPPMAPPLPPPIAPPRHEARPPSDSSPWAGGPRAMDTPAALPPPAIPLGGVTGAATALGASNAAAAAAWVAPRPEPAPAAAPPPPAARPVVRPENREVLRLIWYDPEVVPRMRRVERWRPIWRELAERPLDRDLDDAAAAADPMDLEDRREVFELIARADPADTQTLNEALSDAVREDGKFIAPLVFVAGDIEFPFDELETLKATLTTVSPLVGSDEVLKANVEAAKDFLKTPDLVSAPGVAESLTKRVQEAFAQGKRMVSPAYVEAQTERVLLEKRHYQRRELLGATHLRGLLQMPGSSSPIPTYLDDGVTKKLPLFQRFKVRAVAEIEFAVDQYEVHPAALRLVALARVMPPLRR